MGSQVEMVFWDVQHGHSTYIKSPNKRHIVIDLGIGDYSGNDSLFSPLRHLKFKYNVTQLDYVIITHPHLDHIDDILNFDLLNPKAFHRPKQISNQELMEGVRQQDKAKYLKYCEINNRYNYPLKGGINDPNNTDNFGGMKIMSFSPLTCSHDNKNNHSIITVIEYADIKVVIPGDNQKDSFDELLIQNSFKTAVKDAYILLAPHHGRESGYNIDFINLVNPKLTVVSDGRFCDTSANRRYSQKSSGWLVHKNELGTSTIRKCLTTNSDGEVFIKFGYNDDKSRFLEVKI